MNHDDRWLGDIVRGAIDPGQVESTLQQIRENWPPNSLPLRELIEDFPLGAESLSHLLSVSSICCTRLIRHPEILMWLANTEVAGAHRGYGRMVADLTELSNGQPIAEDNFRALRLWKGREMVRIALREVADAAPLEETLLELSQIADICLAQVFEHWNAALRRRWGSPKAEFAILGVGKLGGRELNHSSDIDVIFLYTDEGQLTPNFNYHEWFTRLANKVIDTFAAADSAGWLFRIDLRLRPEGSAGPLVRSLDSMENYYAGFGETWERLALIKARWICGNNELAYEFLRRHQPFIFPKSPTPDLLDEVAAIKRRIERDIVGHENLHRDVKLGVGGIREIEFVVQALQFIHGARHTFLQETSTLKALHGLTQLDLLPQDEAAALEVAYRFLRRVEHRLQIEAEQQIHTIPETAAPLRRLALSLGFATARAFTSTLGEHMKSVREVFNRIIQQSHPGREQSSMVLQFFHDESRAAKALIELSRGSSGFHLSPRTRQVFGKLKPLLLNWLSKSADPDATLNHFVRFVEAYGLRSLLFELLVVNPRLLELLVKTFDASQSGGALLIRRPQLVEDITRGGMLDQSLDVDRHLERLRSRGAAAENLDPVRAYRQTESLRILWRDLLQLAPFPTLLAEQSALAEACLVHLNEIVNRDSTLTIIALGKFGGREITYGADLDLLFVGEDVRAAQNLLVANALPSAEGSLALFDARLRPEGEKGPLVCSLSSYRDYYAARAQLWELQTLTRARGIRGPLQIDFIALAQEAWRRAGRHEDLFRQIDNMLKRISAERGGSQDFLELKTGRGGIIAAEFLVQALQMRAGIWEPNFSRAVHKLGEGGGFAKAEIRELEKSYWFLRRCESALRRWYNRNVSTLSAEPPERRKLALRLGFEKEQDFETNYRSARETIDRLYAHYIR